MAVPPAVPVRWASCITSKRKSAAWPTTSKVPVIFAAVVKLENARLRFARPLIVSAWLRTFTVPVPLLKLRRPDPRPPEVGLLPSVIVLAFRILVVEPSWSVCVRAPEEMSPMPMRLAVIVLVGASLTMDVAPFVAA